MGQEEPLAPVTQYFLEQIKGEQQSHAGGHRGHCAAAKSRDEEGKGIRGREGRQHSEQHPHKLRGKEGPVAELGPVHHKRSIASAEPAAEPGACAAAQHQEQQLGKAQHQARADHARP